MFKLLDKLSLHPIHSVGDVLADERLSRYLWVELLINPEAVAASRDFLHDPVVRNAVEKAVTWYAGYRYLFDAANRELERVAADQRIEHARIGWREYRENIKAFLKGLQCLGLL